MHPITINVEYKLNVVIRGDMEEQQQEPINEVAQPVQERASSKTDVLGIISVVIAFTGFHLIGFIIGLLGASKAKKENYSVTLSRLGWILNLVFMTITIFFVVVLLSIPALQRNQRDMATKSDLSLVESEILVYRSNNNGRLPASLSDLDLNSTSLNGTAQEKDIQYELLPLGCSSNCTDYILSVELENGTIYELSSN